MQKLCTDTRSIDALGLGSLPISEVRSGWLHAWPRSSPGSACSMRRRPHARKALRSVYLCQGRVAWALLRGGDIFHVVDCSEPFTLCILKSAPRVAVLRRSHFRSGATVLFQGCFPSTFPMSRLVRCLGFSRSSAWGFSCHLVSS